MLLVVSNLSASAIFVEVVLQSWSWFVWQKRLVMARRVASYMAKVHSTQDDDSAPKSFIYNLKSLT